MAELVSVSLNGREVLVKPGCTVAAAILNAGVVGFRQSVDGAARGPVCGMGICFECRVTIDGRMHQRGCMVACEPGMVITTDV